MREIIHSGRCGLALIVFILSMTLLAGQEPSPPQKDAAQAAAQAAATPPPPPVANTGAAPAPDPAKAQDAAAPIPQPPAAQPPAAQPQGRGKASTKKGKADSGNGACDPTSTEASDKPYVIGPEDVLFINVLHTADVTGQYQVRPDGFLSVRFAGEIKAAGLTTQKLADVITDKLTKYFNHPEVDLQVVRINSKKYYVSGQVRRPGVYTLSVPKTVLEALIDAGDTADFARIKGIYILRGTQKIRFNYKDVNQGRNLCQNILLENGDVIHVP